MRCQICKAYAEYLTIVKTTERRCDKKHIGKSVCDDCLVIIGGNEDE